MHKQRLLTCVLFLVLSVSQYAQSTCDLIISGRVVDEHDSSDLAFANIVALGQNIGTTSDAEGRFTLEGLCPGLVVLACSHVGCEVVFDTINLIENTVHNFHPEHHAELLKAVAVDGERSDYSEISIAQTLNRPDRVKGSTLGESLKSLPGVSALNTGGSISKPMVHGLHSNRLLVLNNGIRQEGQQWGREHAPEIDPFIAEEVIVIKGASSVQYGSDAIAGVILVNPKPLPDSFGLAGTVNLVGQSNGRSINSAAMLEGRNKKILGLRWRAQGSLKKAGNQNAPDYYLKNTGLEEWNFSGAMALKNTQRGLEVFYSQFNTNLGILSASHIGNLTDLQRAFEADQPLDSAGFSYVIARPFQHVTHELVKASAYTTTGERGMLSLTYARQYNLREEFDNHSSVETTPALSFEITTHTVDLHWKFQQSNRSILKVGGSGIVQANTFTGRFFIPNFNKWNAGVFAIQHWHLPGKWVMEFGGRMDYVKQLVFIRSGDDVNKFQHVYLQPSGSVGMSKSFNQNLKWTANLSTAWRPPSVNELYSNGLHHGAATFEIGDTSLRQEVSYSWNSQVEYTKNKFSAQADVFVNYMEDFINLEATFPATLTIRGAFPTYKYVQLDALIYGVDAQIEYKILPSLLATSETSLLRARNLSNSNWLSQMPADRSKLELEYQFPNLKEGQTIYVASNAIWINKQWRLPSNSDYVAPPSTYLLFGTNIGATFPTKSGDLNIHLEINNLLNQRYRNYLNRYRYYADEIGRNIILRLSASF